MKAEPTPSQGILQARGPMSPLLFFCLHRFFGGSRRSVFLW